MIDWKNYRILCVDDKNPRLVIAHGKMTKQGIFKSNIQPSDNRTDEVLLAACSYLRTMMQQRQMEGSVKSYYGVQTQAGKLVYVDEGYDVRIVPEVKRKR